MEWMLMPLRRYAEFSGRSRPMELWMFALLQLIIYVVLFAITFVIGAGFAGFASANGPSASPTGLMGMVMAMGVFALVYVLVYLGLFIPNLAVSTRRLHDTGRSGWWVMLYFGPWLLGMVIGFANVGAQSQGLAMIGLLLSGLQLLAIVVLIVFWCLTGTPGPNQHGPSPMGGAGNLAETFQ